MARKRSRSVSSASSSGYESEDTSRKRSRRDKGKDRERYKPSKSEQLDADDDFYAKSREFRHWLQHGRSRSKDFAKLDSREQRKYFKKFVKRWNRGKLDRSYYDGRIVGDKRAEVPASTQTDQYQRLGPARPTLDDITLQREAESDKRAADRDSSRFEHKRKMRDAKQEERESRATGRDRVQEKRLEARQSNREMAAAKEQGDMEFGDDYLMGGSGNSFAEAIRRRENNKAYQERQRKEMEKRAILDEKRTEHRKKEDATLAMLKSLAAAKYGPSQ